MDMQIAKEEKTKAFKNAAARQRGKIKGLKAVDMMDQNDEMMMGGGEEERIEALAQQAPQPLTA